MAAVSEKNKIIMENLENRGCSKRNFTHLLYETKIKNIQKRAVIP
jgi:hypothetical protein